MLCFATSLLVALCVGPGTGGAATALPAPPLLDITESMAAAQLAADEGLPREEAQRQILLQPSLMRILGRAQSLPGFLGAYIDHQDGGRIVLRGSQPIDADGIAASVGALGAARFDQSAVSLADLASDRDALDQFTTTESTRPGRAPIRVMLNVRAGKLEVSGPNDSAQASRFMRVVAGLKHSALLDATTEQGEPVACGFPSCSPPLHGGLTEATNVGYGGFVCTIGFVARGASSGLPFVTTAGHCSYTNPATGQPLFETWLEQFDDAGQTWHPIGTDVKTVYDDYGDFRATAINNPAGWSPAYAVQVYTGAYSSQYPTTYDSNYAITADSANVFGGPYRNAGGTIYGDLLAPGYYLCHTGSTSHTSCGPVVGDNITYQYGVPNSHHLFLVHMEGCEGDSGGPVFIQHTAFGEVVAHGAHDLPNRTTVSGIVSHCSNYTYAYPIGDLENQLNIRVYPNNGA